MEAGMVRAAAIAKRRWWGTAWGQAALLAGAAAIGWLLRAIFGTEAIDGLLPWGAFIGAMIVLAVLDDRHQKQQAEMADLREQLAYLEAAFDRLSRRSSPPR
jgi:hypothetical protein